MITEIFKEKLVNAISTTKTIKRAGHISRVIGLVVESDGPKAPIGEICNIIDREGNVLCKSEIVGFKDETKILSMVLGDLQNILPGMEIVATGNFLEIGVGENYLGRIINGIGEQLMERRYSKYGSRSIYAQPQIQFFAHE
jgi:flagellum-specific ATP synthase